MGMRLVDSDGPGLSRAGGAGPSDHKAIELNHQIVMVPIFTRAASHSPFEAHARGDGSAELFKAGQRLGAIKFPAQPRFYALSTAEGIPYWKIATLHGGDVLATTVLQNCVRYADRATACQFCAIGQSLAARSTIPRKTPQQLAEVAKAAVSLDKVAHMVLTTGTPPGTDRGAALLCESAVAIREAVELPLQGQCEPPDDDSWYGAMKRAGIDTLGMHLEAVSQSARERIMPGKAEVTFERYLHAFRAAIEVFGRGQVTTYILAGLGDTERQILDACAVLLELGVYPFVVPFVPISGTPLEHHPPPDALFMSHLLDGVATLIDEAGLSSEAIKAGCGRCGACSTLKSREPRRQGSTALAFGQEGFDA